MKVILLDIDGVLVPDYQKVNDQAFSKNNPWDAEPFSKLGMDILNEILEKTGAKIVISSDWRITYSLQSMREIFYEAGVYGGEDTIIGFTPRFRVSGEDKAYILNRGNEIKEWVNLHRPENWVAIDDLDLSENLEEDHFIHCKRPIEGIKQSGRKSETIIKLGN